MSRTLQGMSCTSCCKRSFPKIWDRLWWNVFSGRSIFSYPNTPGSAKKNANSSDEHIINATTSVYDDI